MPLPGRNDPCLCGSGKKFKRCCDLIKDTVHVDERKVLQAERANPGYIAAVLALIDTRVPSEEGSKP
jgi:hypothetical protein